MGKREIKKWRLKIKGGDEHSSILRPDQQAIIISAFFLFPSCFLFLLLLSTPTIYLFCTFILNYFIKNLWGKKNNVKDFSPVEPVVGTQLVFFSFGLLGTAGERERQFGSVFSLTSEPSATFGFYFFFKFFYLFIYLLIWLI